MFLGLELCGDLAQVFDAQLRFSVPVADKGSEDWINDDGVTLYWMPRYVP